MGKSTPEGFGDSDTGSTVQEFRVEESNAHRVQTLGIMIRRPSPKPQTLSPK